MKRREKDPEDINYRICGKNEESIYHLICSCPVLASAVYLHTRNSQVARMLCQEVLNNERMEFNPPEVTIKGHLEVWWDHKVTATRKTAAQ